jgi:hypothetical protein
MMVIYHDNQFKSILNEFKALTEKQLNELLNRIPNDPALLTRLINEKYEGKLIVEEVKAIGSEPDPIAPEVSSNVKIARFCEFFEIKTGIKYKVSAADSGKIALVKLSMDDWDRALKTYFDSDNFLFKNKYSILNLVKYYNELRIEAFGKPAGKTFPIPYDPNFFAKLDTNDQREYWRVLKENGYRFEPNSGRGGNWVKRQDLINQ